MSNFSTPAGWYPDGDGWERRWDGSGWTEERRRMQSQEATQVRPASPPAAQAPHQPTHQPVHQPPAVHQPPPGPPTAAPPQGPWQGPQSWPLQPPPGPRRQGRAWLWVVLAVVLVVALSTAITLAVVQPWSDGDRKAGGEGGSGGEGGDGGGDGADAAVQGDVDGDGLGDARYYVYLDYDDVTKVEALSNGNGFELSEVAVEPYNDPADLYFDWDGDGVNEHLTWEFVASGKQITLESDDDDFPDDQTFTVSLSTLREYGDPEIQVVNGDFDGDGDQDLAIAGPNDRVVDVSVLANDGTGTFADPVLWLSLPNAVIDATRIFPGDFDKDGDADLWAQLPAERLVDEDYSGYYSGDRGYALLRSSGKTFEAGAVSESSEYFDELLVGDVTGDGTASLVGVQTNSYKEELTVQVLDVSSGSFKTVAGFTGTSTIGQRSLQGATLSDVDGDGRSDLVFVVKAYAEKKFTGVQVMRSTGAVFEPALVWAETPTCTDDNCRIEFLGSRR